MVGKVSVYSGNDKESENRIQMGLLKSYSRRLESDSKIASNMCEGEIHRFSQFVVGVFFGLKADIRILCFLFLRKSSVQSKGIG